MRARTVRPSSLLACAALCAGLLALWACGGQTAATGDAGTSIPSGGGSSGGSSGASSGSGSSGSSSGTGSSSSGGSTSSSGSGSSSGVDSTSSSSGADSGSLSCGSSSSSGGGCQCAADQVCDTGNRCLTVLAKGLQVPAGIVVDATNVYWLGSSTVNLGQPANGTVMKCAVGGCNQQPTVLAAGQSPSGIALDATNVYWSNTGTNGYGTDGALMKCALGGCGQAPTVILSGGIGPNSIAVDATRVYWTISGNNSGSVWSCPLAGCTPSKIADTVGNPVGVTVSSTTLMWGTSSFGGDLWACSPGSCAPSVLVSSTSQTPVSFGMDGTSAYFMTRAALLRCALGGCGNTPTSLDASVDFGVDFPGAVASDGVSVYFTTTPMGPCGAVMKCPVGGCNGQPTIIASLPGISSPGSLALDATYVYWTDFNLGMVLRALK